MSCLTFARLRMLEPNKAQKSKYPSDDDADRLMVDPEKGELARTLLQPRTKDLAIRVRRLGLR